MRPTVHVETPRDAARVPARPLGARVRWLLAWAGERFPLRNAVFFAVFHAAAVLVARRAAGAPAALQARDAAAFLALWAFFLVLRVADEHKDFAADAVAHPHRVLQRGLVTLGDLRMVAGLALVLQLTVSLWLDGGVGVVTGCWSAALAWSVLMAREFFASSWLRARIVPYALSHMVVMPLLALWIACTGAPRALGSRPVLAYAALSYAAGLAFEIARKLRAPEEERAMADSYTRALGVRGASVLLGVVLAVAGALALVVVAATRSTVAPWQLAVAALGVAAGAAALHAFAQRPTPAAAKRAELAVGVALLAAHGMVAAAAVSGLAGGAR